jgi:hypothetical protein
LPSGSPGSARTTPDGWSNPSAPAAASFVVFQPQSSPPGCVLGPNSPLAQGRTAN